MASHKGNPITALAAYLARESEDDFLTWLIDLARVNGWKGAHFRGGWSRDGERFTTPVQADGEGFPDLVLTRDSVTIYAETKTEKGKLTPEQKEWLEVLARNPGNKCFVWRPSDRKEIEEVLKRGK